MVLPIQGIWNSDNYVSTFRLVDIVIIKIYKVNKKRIIYTFDMFIKNMQSCLFQSLYLHSKLNITFSHLNTNIT